MALSNGTIVTIFEDPQTQLKREGNAKVMGFVQPLEPGLDQYVVHFIGDAPGFHVVRTIAENGPLCSGTDPVRCDDSNCRVHGESIRAHWVGTK